MHVEPPRGLRDVAIAKLIDSLDVLPPHPVETTLNAARRKAMTIAFARAAALRLHGLYDPETM